MTWLGATWMTSGFKVAQTPMLIPFGIGT